MKKVISVLCVGLILLSFAGCSVLSKPNKTISTFCDSLVKQDFDTIKTCFVNTDDNIKDEFTYGVKNEDESSTLTDYYTQQAANIKYSIENTESDKNTAIVTVKFTYTDASQLIKETFGAYMEQAFAIAFSNNSDESALSKLFVDIFNQKKDSVTTGLTESTVDFKCTKTKDGWKINEMPEDIINVYSCNMVSVFKNMTSDEPTTESADMNYIDVAVNQPIELATVKFHIIDCKETKTLSNDYSSKTADEGTKFIVLTVEAENITKEAINLDLSDVVLKDNQDRSFKQYNDQYMYDDNVINYNYINPNMKKQGTIIYNVPEDAFEYYLLIGKKGTNDYYKFATK